MKVFEKIDTIKSNFCLMYISNYILKIYIKFCSSEKSPMDPKYEIS
jgi:hypothetical protein